MAAELARYAELFRVSGEEDVPLWRSRYPTFPPVLCVLAGAGREALGRRRDTALALLGTDPQLTRTPGSRSPPPSGLAAEPVRCAEITFGRRPGAGGRLARGAGEEGGPRMTPASAAKETGIGRPPGRPATQAGRPRAAAHGDCVEVLAGLRAGSFDAVVCDPPYGIGWQNEHWDGAAIRAAAGRSGRGRLTPNESFEVWCEMWGRECARVMKPGAHLLAFGAARTSTLACGLEDAGLEVRDTLMWLYGTGMPKSRRYPDGRATTLKPAFEPIVLARKALEGTTEENLAAHGTGALETEACRTEGATPPT